MRLDRRSPHGAKRGALGASARGRRSWLRGTSRLAGVVARAVATVFALLSIVLANPVDQPSASAVTSPVSVTLTSSTGSLNDFRRVLFPGEIIQYNILVSNTGATPAPYVTVSDPLPLKDAKFITGSPTCGSVPNCTAYVYPHSVVFVLSSVAAGASNLQMSFQMSILPKRDILDLANWTGPGCHRTPSCQTKPLYNRILEPPLVLKANPKNRAKVAVTHTIDFTLTMHSYGYISGEPQIVINTQPITVDAASDPAGTSYVPGSASCGATPGCTASESSGIVTFTLTPASFPAGANAVMAYAFVNNANTGTLTESATWAGGACPQTTCPPRFAIAFTAFPGHVTPPPPPPTTTPPPHGPPPNRPPPNVPPGPPVSVPVGHPTGIGRTGGAVTPPGTTHGSSGSQNSSTGKSPGKGTGGVRASSSFALSPPTIAPGGTTVAYGTGCPALSTVVISIDGKTLATTTADGRGAFSASLTPRNLRAGQYTVTATCGTLRMSAVLTIALSSSASTPESSAAAFGVFVLLGLALMRGQFNSDVKKRKGKGKGKGLSKEDQAALGNMRPAN
jgi:uncharacterized repeat protein (TIGR01451 family)